MPFKEVIKDFKTHVHGYGFGSHHDSYRDDEHDPARFVEILARCASSLIWISAKVLNEQAADLRNP
ncbi:MAG TPA: hypothetical protein ACFCUD_12190 [Cyclobacteriaceae bacterium]